MKKLRLGIVVLALIAAACAADDAVVAPEETGATTTGAGVSVAPSGSSTTVGATTLPPQLPDQVPPTTGDQVVTGEVPDSILREILADAAGRTSVAAGDMVVLRGEQVIWSDGSLGCPQPGVVYTQALVEGYWVVVDAAGEVIDYRVTQNGSFIVCDQSQAGFGRSVPGDDSNK